MILFQNIYLWRKKNKWYWQMKRIRLGETVAMQERRSNETKLMNWFAGVWWVTLGGETTVSPSNGNLMLPAHTSSLLRFRLACHLNLEWFGILIFSFVNCTVHQHELKLVSKSLSGLIIIFLKKINPIFAQVQVQWNASLCWTDLGLHSLRVTVQGGAMCGDPRAGG